MEQVSDFHCILDLTAELQQVDKRVPKSEGWGKIGALIVSESDKMEGIGGSN